LSKPNKLRHNRLRLEALFALKFTAQDLEDHNIRLTARICNPEKALIECSKLPKVYGLSLPEESTIDVTIKRLCCCRWWKRKLFSLQRQLIEGVACDVGIVHLHSSTYSSIYSQLDRAAQRRATQA
jgi:hypothetical protein